MKSRVATLIVAACLAMPGLGWAGSVGIDVSGDGRSAIFSALDGDLYRLDLGDGRVTRLARTDEEETLPACSPDGRRVAYSAARPGQEGSGLRVRNLADGSVRTLTDTPGVSDGSPSFSPDGTQVVFIRAGRLRPASMGGMRWVDFDAWVVPAEGGEARRLTSETYWTADSPSFTPDGQNVIFTASHNLYPEPSYDLLLLVAADGRSRPRAIGPDPSDAPRKMGAWISSPRSARDGGRIAFVSDRHKPFAYDLYLSDPDGGNPRPLGIAATSRQNAGPAFLPGGRGLLYLGVAKGETRYGLWRVGLDGKAPHQIAGERFFNDPLNTPVSP